MADWQYRAASGNENYLGKQIGPDIRDPILMTLYRK